MSEHINKFLFYYVAIDDRPLVKKLAEKIENKEIRSGDDYYDFIEENIPDDYDARDRMHKYFAKYNIYKVSDYGQPLCIWCKFNTEFPNMAHCCECNKNFLKKNYFVNEVEIDEH